MDPKKHNTRTENDADKKAAPTSGTKGNKPGNGSEDISPDPFLAEKDEVKIAEEKLRNKTKK